MHPDLSSPFGVYRPSRGRRRLLELAQRAPRNAVGNQLARWARGLYLWKAPLPVDVVVEGIRLRCYLRDNTGERKFVFTPGRFDPMERRALAAGLPTDGVFVDIGANVGIYTLTAALLLGSQGRVLAIEPHVPAARRLRFNIEATRSSQEDWPRIDVLEIGVSDRDESRELRIDDGNLGGGSIVAGEARFSRAGSSSSSTIHCRPLLDILAEAGVRRIDALKIDIEGAEDLALRPFLETAPDSLLPRLMIVERSEQLWHGDLAAWLSARGYRVRQRTRLNTLYALA
jgi:FkbM family methyltransferase